VGREGLPVRLPVDGCSLVAGRVFSSLAACACHCARDYGLSMHCCLVEHIWVLQLPMVSAMRRRTAVSVTGTWVNMDLQPALQHADARRAIMHRRCLWEANTCVSFRTCKLCQRFSLVLGCDRNIICERYMTCSSN
jgi:hypothetical protein